MLQWYLTVHGLPRLLAWVRRGTTTTHFLLFFAPATRVATWRCCESRSGEEAGKPFGGPRALLPTTYYHPTGDWRGQQQHQCYTPYNRQLFPPPTPPREKHKSGDPRYQNTISGPDRRLCRPILGYSDQLHCAALARFEERDDCC